MRLPDNTQRLLIVGRTGSGKSRAAVWHLALRDWDVHPWVILDYKGEELFQSIPDAKHVELSYTPDRKKGGIFIFHPIPERDDEAVDELLWRIHARGGIGVYIDEGYMIDPRSSPMIAILTQGRSKRIPVIVLSQRPTRISRFAVSESDFYQVFELNDKRDRETFKSFVPYDLETIMKNDVTKPRILPAYHSLYYDVSGNKLEVVTPVPSDSEIIKIFKDRIPLTQTQKRLI